MSMKFRTLPESKIINLDLLQATEALNELKTAADRDWNMLACADQILDNIYGAMESISKYGDTDAAVIAICNADHALEVLTNKKLKDITKDVALEALDDAQKSGWQKFADAVKAILSKIIAFLRSLFTSTDHKIQYLKDLTAYTPTDKQYTVLPKDKAKVLDLMITDVLAYVDWLQSKAYQVKESLEVGTIANEADVKMEEILKKYTNYLAKKEGVDFPILTWVGDETALETTTLTDAGYPDINRVKVFLSDINNNIISAARRAIVPMATKLEDGVASLVSWLMSKSDSQEIADTGKLIKGLEMASMESLRVYAKVSALMSRTIDAIYTDAHAAEPNAAPAA